MACTAAQSRILGFLTKSVAVLGQQGGQIGQALQGVLADGRLPVSDLQPAVVPACVLMPGLLLDPRDPLMQSLADCVDDLHWTSPGFGRIPDAVSRQMAVVEILGRDGMFVHQRVRLGVLLQGEHLLYPNHKHLAQEVYHVLSGRAGWSVDSVAFQPREVGDFIYHRSNQLHAMKTQTDPLLALWAWWGDIRSVSYEI